MLPVSSPGTGSRRFTSGNEPYNQSCSSTFATRYFVRFWHCQGDLTVLNKDGPEEGSGQLSPNNAQRPARSQKELDRFVQVFHYEVEMLRSQGLLYLDHGREVAEDRSDGRQVVADALLDSLLNRLRAFDAFFGLVWRKDTDAIASDPDLTNGWEEGQILLPATYTSICRRLSHLTYDRPPEHVWHIGIMIRKALEAVRDFLRATLVDDGNWNDRLNDIECDLANWGERDCIRTSRERGHAYRA